MIMVPMTNSLLIFLLFFCVSLNLCTSFIQTRSTGIALSTRSQSSLAMMATSNVMSPLELLRRDEGRKVKDLEKALGADEMKTRGLQALKESSIGRELASVFRMREVVILFIVFRSYKRMLRAMYKVQRKIQDKLMSSIPALTHPSKYGTSLFGYLEEPFTAIAWSIPILYIADVGVIIANGLGISLSKNHDMIKLLYKALSCIVR